MIKSSHLNTQTTISSALECDYTDQNDDEEDKHSEESGVLYDINRIFERFDNVGDEQIDYEYSSDALIKETSEITFSSYCAEIMRKKDLPTPVFAGK